MHSVLLMKNDTLVCYEHQEMDYEKHSSVYLGESDWLKGSRAKLQGAVM